MDRSKKVELFEQIRREYEFGAGTIAGVARQFGVHRRMVRQALKSAIPPQRQSSPRRCPRLDAVRSYIDQMLEADRQVPRKQRHTAHRIYTRLREEHPQHPISERRVRQYVHQRKRELGLLVNDVFVPQSYQPGVEAQVDWYEAQVELAGERQVIQIFALRSMASGASFHRAYFHATQHAFLEAHQHAFHYFGGVFQRLRYDNLKSAVWKVVRGYQREQTQRFLAFRSHWQFEASFCTPGQGHEKGGVEGEVGYFRRNHLVPIPVFETLEAFNTYLLQCCQEDLKRHIHPHTQSVGQRLTQEQPFLRALQPEDFAVCEELFCRVDSKGCVQIKTNWYSTPLRSGTQVQVQLWPSWLQVLDQGQEVARHRRYYTKRQQYLELEHYLEVLWRKPGALAGSTPLAQWRAAGRWREHHDRLWSLLMQRHGQAEGTRLMIELLQLGREYGYQRLDDAINQALACGAQDAAAVCYLLTASTLASTSIEPLEYPGDVLRPLPTLTHYDQLREVV